MKDISADRTDWTDEDYLKAHRDLWTWLAEQIKKRQEFVPKREYFEAKGIKEIPLCGCFLCEHALRKSEADETHSGTYCEFCLVDWGSRPNECAAYKDNEFGDMFSMSPVPNTKRAKRFRVAKVNYDYKQAAEFAKRIAELPERTEP